MYARCCSNLQPRPCQTFHCHWSSGGGRGALSSHARSRCWREQTARTVKVNTMDRRHGAGERNDERQARPGSERVEIETRVPASAALPAPAEDKTTTPAVRITDQYYCLLYHVAHSSDPTHSTGPPPPVSCQCHCHPDLASRARARIKRRRRPLLPLPLCHRPFPRSIHPSTHPKATHMDSSGS